MRGARAEDEIDPAGARGDLAGDVPDISMRQLARHWAGPATVSREVRAGGGGSGYRAVRAAELARLAATAA